MTFIESEYLLLFSQEPATAPYPKLLNPVHTLDPNFFKVNFNTIFPPPTILLNILFL
jgi:hypothetical protein